MGIEKDYLMRQLKMLIDVIQKIVNFRKKGMLTDARREISYFYSCLHMPDEILSQSTESFLNFLTHQKFTNDQLELIAYVLKEQGEMEENAKTQLNFFRKSYFLLDKVDRESTTFSMERQMKIGELLEYIRQ